MEPQTRDHEVSVLLASASAGEREAFDRVFKLVYDELRRLARQVRRGRASDTLSTTALVHEAYLRLLPSRGLAWEGRSHFMAVAARAMRQVLVRAAERHATAKRGGGQADLSLDESAHRPLRQARVVECRFFAGLSVEETAQALAISEPTVKRDWSAARAWLAREVAGA
jgi:DNA-directed RNA polymerase specialized sigma24 family protein